jgi:hypothetical protein
MNLYGTQGPIGLAAAVSSLFLTVRLVYFCRSTMDRRMETAETGFKYEVAFSFTGEDEGLATQINDLLRDRYRTFLYSREQEKLAGTDGEETFNDVFGKEARTVAVLLRPEWGSSAWTRIEQIATKK